MSQAIYLASQSPRRKELLSQLNIQFDTLHAEIDETPFENEEPESHVNRLAQSKAKAGWEKSDKTRPVLGSDTIVVLDNLILGKPKNQADAIATLLKLSGQKHQVMTSVSIVFDNKHYQEIVISQVEFAEITEKEALEYWQTGEPADKAGSYAIQGIGGQFVKHISGNYSAIVGLPLYQTKQLLALCFKQLN
ncbi:Maf family protein [Catenovulum maritimum]|uniref:dTTP/UTP pyrophosphatase n=1 Tax=Catenovulum maritimum TaxID=1513271 RepID=A0A0J8JHQ3_9ALTE|nr:Maf family protein [Catenovulum maritimum]KMT63961.1 hypothetical protein XM47_16755 [Catenovulum maritimum]